MGVKLREKQLVSGEVSLYLDIVHNGKRWAEFLDIRINRKKATPEDTKKRKLALEIKVKREHEIIISDHGLVDKKSKREDFVKYFEEYQKQKPANCNRSAALYTLRKFIGNKPLPISSVTTQWMKDFERFILQKLKTSTAMTYLMHVNGVLNELVRKKVISQNPWHAVPVHDRLKIKKSSPVSWTIEQLEQLDNTPSTMEPQFRQAYFFSCFTGLRWSDVNKLQWSNIVRRKFGERTEWFLDFEQQKTDSKEYFPLSDQAVKILKDREAAQDHAVYVFPKVKETNARTKSVQGRIDYGLKVWAAAAGLDKKKMRFHTGRHTYATNLLEATKGDLLTVSKLLGHKSIQTTLIYAQVRDRTKEAAVRSLPELNPSRSGKKHKRNTFATKQAQ